MEPGEHRRLRSGWDGVVRRRGRGRRAGVLEAEGGECFKNKIVTPPSANDNSREVFLPVRLSGFYLIHTHVYTHSLSLNTQSIGWSEVN